MELSGFMPGYPQQGLAAQLQPHQYAAAAQVQQGMLPQMGAAAAFSTAAAAPARSAGPNRFRGIVKRWNVQKGYGFLLPAEGGEDVFVHHSVVHAPGFRSLLVNSEVEYEREPVPQKPGCYRATKVTGPGGSYAKGAANDQDGQPQQLMGGLSQQNNFMSR